MRVSCNTFEPLPRDLDVLKCIFTSTEETEDTVIRLMISEMEESAFNTDSPPLERGQFYLFLVYLIVNTRD